jgi:hypothetical protein
MTRHNPERQREYRAANAEKIRERARRYRASEKGRETRRRYREAHREEIKADGRRRYLTNPERFMWFRHGLRPEDWWALWASQGGCCYLCEAPLPKEANYRVIVIEHDHRCCPPARSCPRCRRGLAHAACNTLIGLADDDPAELCKIAANLERAKRQVAERPAPLVLFAVADLEQAAGS